MPKTFKMTKNNPKPLKLPKIPRNLLNDPNSPKPLKQPIYPPLKISKMTKIPLKPLK